MKYEQVLDRQEVIRNLEIELRSKVITFCKNPNNNDGGIINESCFDCLGSVLERIGDNEPLALMIRSHGGLTSSGTKIAKRLRQHMGPVTIIVPEEAYSAATLISLSGDKIVCGSHAHFTPVESQYETEEGIWISILDMQKSSKPELRSASGRVLRQTREDLDRLLSRSIRDSVKIQKIADRLLLQDKVHASHASLIEPTELKEIGVEIDVGLSPSALALHNLYKQHSFSADDPSIIVEYTRDPIPPNITHNPMSRKELDVAMGYNYEDIDDNTMILSGVCPICGNGRLLVDIITNEIHCSICDYRFKVK